MAGKLRLVASDPLRAITWNDRRLTCLPGETVLSRLHRAGVRLPYSCRSGTCWLCMVRCRAGTPPARSQEMLRPSQRATGLLLACQCVLEPGEALTLEPADTPQRLRATVRRVLPSTAGITRLFVEPNGPFDYHAGQYAYVDLDLLPAEQHASLEPPMPTSRPYSLASVPRVDALVELHIENVPGGALSPRLCALAAGDTLGLTGPYGECVYVPVHGRLDQPLLLAGMGAGLAPLVGIARDALRAGHRGPIHLIHGAPTREGLYLDEELRSLAARHPTFTYVPAILDPQEDTSLAPIRLEVALAQAVRKARDARVFLCGSPATVDRLSREAVLAGAHPDELHVDPFTPSRTAADEA